MSDPARRPAKYEDLYGLPENATGEIIDGELIVTPGRSRKHVYAGSSLGALVGPSYQFGHGGGPGGWIILIEPEIALGANILVPDLAGWRRERFPQAEETNWIAVVPDWVCEILSPGTLRVDKVKKMPLYAAHGVCHLWLVDPLARRLDAFELDAGRWVLLGTFVDDDKVAAEPFAQVEIDLACLWLGYEPPSPRGPA